MTSAEIRKTFLDFFASKGHTIVPSAPIVVKNDPTLMFTNAGMNQFKDWFLGNETPKYKRVADTQKCLRVSGKHDDLEDVGIDTYHHTMFEMLGNWSFGDYFKKEAIEWAWELLTEVYKLPKDRLYVTVFEGDENEGLAFDQEAFDIWSRKTDINHIVYGNKKDNFWEMADTGPCGPCSEIHIDLRPDAERKAVDGKTLVNNDHPQVIEIWNNVFMQFERIWNESIGGAKALKDWSESYVGDNFKKDRSKKIVEYTKLIELPSKCVDTGMGFERLVRAIEGKSSNYDTDVFVPTIQFIEKASGINYAYSDSKQDVAMRVLADHIRAISFTIADGQLPSNNGAGYVIRRILRRAVRYQYQFLGLKEPFLCTLVPLIADNFKNVFPELNAQREFVAKVIREEELSFLKTITTGMSLLENIFEDIKDIVALNKANPSVGTSKYRPLSGKEAFLLSDTYGFPIDLTQLIARENGFEVDVAGFESELQKQKERSRKATEITTDDWVMVSEDATPVFLGYDQLEAEVSLIKYRKVKAKGKESYQLVFNQTPFYPEGGGQVGDTGFISNANEKIEIIDTKKENNLIIHFANRLPENIAGTFTAKVDSSKRKATENNHSATHLLHAALRTVLGTHVEQKGSLVNDEYLRFDFSHFAAMTDEEISRVEDMVNAKIRENISLDERRSVPIDEARQLGAMMLFGEKYGETVRVITFDERYSRELCGGTHVKATGQIGYFKIVSEAAVAAGVRRIEAITGQAAQQLINEQWSLIAELKQILAAKDVKKSVEQLLADKTALQKKLEAYELEKSAIIKEQLKKQVVAKDGVNLLIAKTDVPNADQLKNISFQLRNEIENLFCVLGCELNGKPMLSVIIADELVKTKSLHAGNIVKELAKHIQGGGGGQPFYATAGGNNLAGLDEALSKAKQLV